MEQPREALFSRFGIGPAALLGSGGESEVYGLDQARVLRLYKPGVALAYIARRHGFYAWLHQQRPPFEVPRVLEQGTLDGCIYTVERRMGGRAFAAVLPGLRGADRQCALTSYLDVAAQIGTLSFPDRRFGELLAGAEQLQRDSWPQFVWDRLQQTYRASRRDVEADVPGVDAVLAHVAAELQSLEGFRQKSLVHGDYFPGNVYIDDQLSICGVGDFGYTTVVGDPRLDLAGAVAYLEVADGYLPEDTAFLMKCVEQRYGRAMRRWLALYRLYGSFYFSTCKTDDPPTYAWCIGNLRSWLQATERRHPSRRPAPPD